MRVSVNFGGGRGRRNVERRVPRNRHRHYYDDRDRRGRRGGARRGGSSSSHGGSVIIGIVFIVFSLLFGFINYNNANKTKDYIVTAGYVVDYYDDWDSGSDQYLYTEIIEYTVDGKVYEVTNSSSSSTPLPYGSRVNVYYNPVNPAVAVVNQKSNNIIIYVFCGIFGFVGVVSLFAGIKDSFKGSRKQLD